MIPLFMRFATIAKKIQINIIYGYDNKIKTGKNINNIKYEKGIKTFLLNL
jgi:hypothetical protein